MNHYLIMTISGAFPLTFMAVPGQAMSCQQVIPVAVKLRRAMSETDELARLQSLGGGVGLANHSQPMKTPNPPPQPPTPYPQTCVKIRQFIKSQCAQPLVL